MDKIISVCQLFFQGSGYPLESMSKWACPPMEKCKKFTNNPQRFTFLHLATENSNQLFQSDANKLKTSCQICITLTEKHNFLKHCSVSKKWKLHSMYMYISMYMYVINFLVIWSNILTYNSKKNCGCTLYKSILPAIVSFY